MSSKELFKLFLMTKHDYFYKEAINATIEEKQKRKETRKKRQERGHFDLSKIKSCKFLFRFKKSDIIELTRLLLTFSGVEGLCITLRRLSYPNRLRDLCELFNRHWTQISKIFNWTLNYLDQNFGHLLTSVDLFWLEQNYLEYFAMVVQNKNAALNNCVGFIDGTVRANCRPGVHQEAIYNGHKRVHGHKYQSVVLPNGLITNLYGPVPGRRHDGHLLTQSDLINSLRSKFDRGNDNPPFCLYGDPAYPMRDAELLAPFRGEPNEEEQNFNQSMSAVRQSVEWGFG